MEGKLIRSFLSLFAFFMVTLNLSSSAIGEQYLIRSQHTPTFTYKSKSNEKDSSRIKISSILKLRDIGGSFDPDHAFEGVDLDIDFKSIKLPNNKNFTERWNIKISWKRGQVLLFPWFFDLSNLKGTLEANGYLNSYDIFISELTINNPISLKAKNIKVPIKHEFDLRQIKKILADSEIHIIGNLKELYDLLIKDAFSDLHPLVKKIKLKGKLRLDLFKNTIKLILQSNVKIKKKNFINNLYIDLNYPLNNNNCKNGIISWEDLSLNPLIPKRIFKNPSTISILNKKIPVILCYDQIKVGPINFNLVKGSLSVKTIKVNIIKKNLSIKDIIIKDVKLNDIVKNIPYNIKVNGHFSKATYLNNKISFNGEIQIAIAGGYISIKNIWIEPFGPVTRWGGDIAFNHIDLKTLTAKTSFGLITGAVNGWVKHLVMSGYQPEAFDLRIVTDNSSKEPKKISIKAIENLSILGGGKGSISFLGRLFKDFSYSRIGISCRLKNDVFELHGLYKRDNKEYLVERGFWGGVNVVNMNPNGKISFKDMVDRLKRISETQESKVEVR